MYTLKNFEAKTAAITGAGSGLGRALAIQFNAAGAHLALCDMNMEGLQETKTMLPNPSLRTSLHSVDVSDQAAMEGFANEVISIHGQVDILINNAGVTLLPKPMEEIPDTLFKKVIAVNMWGAYYGTRAFLPHLKRQPEAGIVMISSSAGLVGLYGLSPYSMSKFAVRALAESLSMELADTGVSVLTVHPGNVRTNIIKNALDLAPEIQGKAHEFFTKSPALAPETAALKIMKAIQRKRNRLIMGVDAHIIYLIRRLFPRAYPKILASIFRQAKFE